MSPEYESAFEICHEALRTFRADINDYLPESVMPNIEDAEYLYPWDVDSIREVYDIFIRATNKILSTVMANHITFELRCCEEDLHRAIENKPIPDGQRALRKIMHTFGDLAYVIRLLERVEIN